METLVSMLGRNGFLPHGYCFTWSPGLLWSMVASDAVIAAAYFSIPLATLSYVRQRPEATTNRVAWLFSAFIFACGVTHLMGIWTIWQPDYALQALTKIVTAAISLVTAIALWPLIPRALKIPSIQQLRSVIGTLEAEVNRRREAEDQLAAIQQSLAVTLASIDAGFVTTGREGQVTHMNALAETATGWSLANARGLEVWQVLDLWQVVEHHDGTRQLVSLNLLDSMLENTAAMNTVQRVVCVARDGTHTPLEVRATLTRDNDGQVAGLAVVFRDMSRIDKAEAESKRLAAIVESSTDAIVGMTLNGRITNWNGAAQAIFGHSADEAIGQSVQLLIPPERQQEAMRILSELAEGKTVPAFDTVRLRRGGEAIDLSITISPIKDTEGRVVGASKIARDVSVQRRAEAALRASEERLRFTLEAAHVGDWELDLVSGATRHSLRHDRCFGYFEPLSEWTFDIFMAHVHPDDRTEVGEAFEATVSEFRDLRIEFRVVWPDGSVHWLSAHGNVQRVGNQATRMLGIVSEITEQRQAEESRLTAQRLEAENLQIQEASRLKSLFLANMSHELRTPLNAVIGFADLLHSGYVKPDSPQHQEFLGHIASSGKHLLQLINDVLDLSKVESGKFEFFPDHIDLPLLLKEVQDVLHTAVSRKNMRITMEIDPDLVDLTLDAGRLKQVLYNYLSNAIKFTESGGQVVVRAMPAGPDHFRIEVEDNGIGISAADLPRLFTEFQQLDTGYNKQYQGTGLGLALTRRLVQAQGGQVGVRSTVGVGSVFYAVLNRVDGFDTLRAEATEAAEAFQRGLQSREAHRVLVIEDNLQEQARLVEALSQAGFEVDAAADAPHALRRARETAYAALTLDLSLPDRRGLELLDGIRSQGASQTTPVVGVTMPADRRTSAAFAVANVLCKPLRSAEIASSLGRFRLQGAPRANVMVIDDEQVALDLMQATLKSLGIDAVCFQDGRIALQALEQHRPDAIVLDLMMPVFDGFQVLDALQRLPTWRDVPVFIWTGMLLTDEEYAILARSARAIVSKGGGSMEVVLESVRRWRQPTAAVTGERT